MRPKAVPRSWRPAAGPWRCCTRVWGSGKSLGGWARRRPTVARWQAAVKRGGVRALRAKPQPGRPARLSARQAEAVVGDVAQGSRGTRIWNGAVDAPPAGGDHRALPRRPLPSGARVEDSARMRLESAEARAPGTGARRGRDRALAAATVAAYKQTRGAKAIASSSWMKAALCSKRWSGGRGRDRAARRCSANRTVIIGSRSPAC